MHKRDEKEKSASNLSLETIRRLGQERQCRGHGRLRRYGQCIDQERPTPVTRRAASAATTADAPQSSSALPSNEMVLVFFSSISLVLAPVPWELPES